MILSVSIFALNWLRDVTNAEVDKRVVKDYNKGFILIILQ